MGKRQHPDIRGEEADDADAHRRAEVPANDVNVDLGAGEKGQQDRPKTREVVHPGCQCQIDDVARDGKSLVLNLSQQMLQQAPIYEKGKEPVYVPAGEPRGGGWGADTPYGRLYDPAKEQTISGQVVSIETSAPMPGMAPGMQMLVQTDDGKSMRVQVGPVWYLERQDLDLKENTRVQITGAQAEIEGQPVLMAREVQFDGQVITLRDAQGMPKWSSLRRAAAK